MRRYPGALTILVLGVAVQFGAAAQTVPGEQILEGPTTFLDRNDLSDEVDICAYDAMQKRRSVRSEFNILRMNVINKSGFDVILQGGENYADPLHSMLYTRVNDKMFVGLQYQGSKPVRYSFARDRKTPGAFIKRGTPEHEQNLRDLVDDIQACLKTPMSFEFFNEKKYAWGSAYAMR